MVISPTDNRRRWAGQLDIAIADLKRLSNLVSAALLRERNALSSAGSLPSDVLVEIFRFGSTKGSMAASHVCHKWRATAVSEPSLWTYIDMADPAFSENRLRLQLSRAGRLPFDLNFHVMDEGRFFYNIKVPDNIEVLLLNARSVSNITTRTFRNKIDMVELESLHVTLGSPPLDKCLNATPKLIYLSIDALTTHSLDTTLVKNVHTLHLRGGCGSVHKLVETLSGLPHLHELLLASFTDRRSDDPTLSEVEPMLLRALKLLTLTKLPPSLLLKFLTWITLPPSAHLRVDDWPLQLPLHIFNNARRCDAKAAYIDESRQIIYYDHETSISQIKVGNSPMGVLQLPSVISVESIYTLTFMNGHPNPNFMWSRYGNLRNLSFAFHPRIINNQASGLYFVLRNELLINCPRLEFLGIVLRRGDGSATTGIGFRDRAEDALPFFLEYWKERYLRRFHRIRIQDEIKPMRWQICAPFFESLVEHFELGYVSLELPFDPVPRPRRFQPDIDPNSSSLPPDLTAYARWESIR